MAQAKKPEKQVVRADDLVYAYMGPYQICQTLRRIRHPQSGAAGSVVVQDSWTLPGGTSVSSKELYAIANKNNWSLKFG